MTREEVIHELGEWLEQMIQHDVPSYSAKRKALATAIALLQAEAVHKPDYSYEADMVRRLKAVTSAEAEKTYIGIDIPYGSDKGIATIFKGKDDKLILEEVKELMISWIPCSERLPKEEKKTYWVCTDTEYQCECRWTNNRFGIGEGEWGWSIFDTPQYTKPIAWMPLPTPYKGGDQNE